MKAHYGFPSGDYTIVLSRKELDELLKTGHITFRMSHLPCTTSRLAFDEEAGEFKRMDMKSILNCMLFHTNEPVADIEAGDHYVQFLNIHVYKEATDDVGT